MPGSVLRTPEASLWTSAQVEWELDTWITGFTPSDEPDVLDMGTFAFPGATEHGRSQKSIECRFRWAPELVTVLQPLLDTELLFLGRANSSDTKAVKAHVKFAALPWGDFNVGENPEVSMTLIVTDDITYVTPTAGSGS